IGYFVSSHGFGHAARASAVMLALREQSPGVEFDIFTETPEWFFKEALGWGYHYHLAQTDVGVVQSGPLDEDLGATLKRLAGMWPLRSERVDSLAYALQRTDCRLVICDISPLGIAAAYAAGLPAVLIENFTWDWIYAGYLQAEPRLEPYLPLLQTAFAAADLHLQAEPYCRPAAGARVVAPISRPPRTSCAQLRASLQIDEKSSVALVTMGGIPARFDFLSALQHHPEITFIIPGGSSQIETRGNLRLLPHHSPYYHPDLMQACDVVIAKAGYSTIAEAWHAGVPFVWVSRPRFRESGVMSVYLRQEFEGFELSEAEFDSGNWAAQLHVLLEKPHRRRPGNNGAYQAASQILDILL
ncbi:MAG TPA: glycosyltransferase, partial [Anaerolineaceae bacterium]|nr:glycosyltransferase [Anaerolineaceae bacterium]